RQETLPVTHEGEAAPVAAVGAAAPSSGRAARPLSMAGAASHTAGRSFGNAVRRDRPELLAAAVLALAILAGLTSWGALDLGSAASEAAPTVSGPSAD
ncbi:MAG TPA: hypothetical protein VGM28_01210, partial [Candidatus Limnocylindrales bacterium]